MPAYFIAQIQIDDPQDFQNYLSGFMEVFERHGGRLLVTSSKPVEIIEGDWALPRAVLMEFPDLAHAKAWKDDPDYVELTKIRQRLAQTNMVLVEGA